MTNDTNKALQIDLNEHGILINSVEIQLPVALSTLEPLFGEARCTKKKYNTVYTWDNLGIHGYAKDGKTIDTLSVSLLKNEEYDFYAKKDFTGRLMVNGRHYVDLPISRKKKRDNYFKIQTGNLGLFVSIDNDDMITQIEISEYVPPAPLDNPDKYKLIPIKGEKIVFADFNFKLSVVQILMYEKGLIEPAFDVYEFAERYTVREIDIEEDGYEIIPEVKDWFEQLEVDQKFTGEITSIQQDGGNDIYAQLFPFWSGETDDFNIQSFEDVDQFKNLKEMELFYDENQDENIAFLAAKGIKAETL